MKPSRRLLAVSLLLLTVPFAASAEDTPASSVSWEVSAVSDYLFRGVSQTDEKPTLQGEFTWTSAAGVYVGSFASGVDFGSGSPHAEVDYFVGYGHALGDSVALDVSINRYSYPGASELAYNELITKATFADRYSATVGYSNDVWNSGSTGWYYAVGGEWALPHDLTLSANVGRNVFADNVAVAAEDYTDWSVAVSKTMGVATVSLGYYGTDGQGRASFGKLADDRVLLSVKIAR